jgi:hypothetical protein
LNTGLTQAIARILQNGKINLQRLTTIKTMRGQLSIQDRGIYGYQNNTAAKIAAVFVWK